MKSTGHYGYPYRLVELVRNLTGKFLGRTEKIASHFDEQTCSEATTTVHVLRPHHTYPKTGERYCSIILFKDVQFIMLSKR